MISVVIALYNSQKYIKKQLDSILNQSVTVDEVILIDDCSWDRTIETVTNYINKNSLCNWKLYFHNKNKGYVETFREAISYAVGDIIILCDHDDIWEKDKVEVIENAFNGKEKIYYLATSFNQINEKGDSVSIKLKPNHGNNNLIRRKVETGKLNKMYMSDVAIYNIAPGCTCAFSKDIKTCFLNLESDILPHDWKLALIACCMDGLYYLDVVTTNYRIYENNTIGLGHQLNYKKRREVCQSGYTEKKEMLWIVEKLKGKESEEYRYVEEITHIFKKRVDLMESKKKFTKGLPLLMQSFRYGRLAESVGYDLLSMLHTE